MPRGPKPICLICLTTAQHRCLQHLARQTTAAYAQVLRAKIVLAAAAHSQWTNAAIAQRVGCSDRTVRKWRARWRVTRQLADQARGGCPRFFSLGPARSIDRTGLHTAA
jgi:hypothetical protein